MTTNTKHVDLGDLCVHCRRSTSAGSGLWIDRYPVYDMEHVDSGDILTGYCCRECEERTWL
jgi:hypothetical protein